MVKDFLRTIRAAAERGDYALRPHTVSHMLSEGFGESDILSVIKSGEVRELYEAEDRCLIVGRFVVSSTITEFLHVVIDYWTESGQVDWIDVVTAYIPRPPFWETPYTRGKKK